MQKMYWLATRKDKSADFFWETSAYDQLRAATDAVIAEYPTLMVAEEHGYLTEDQMQYYRWTLFPSKEAKDFFRERLEEKFPGHQENRDQYFSNHNHELILNIYVGDGDEFFKSVTLVSAT
jgi:hypothetical protein